MIEAPLNNANEEEQFMYALVPLRSGFLRQASLFDERTYPLPEVIPGEAAVIEDSDEWGDNFKRVSQHIATRPGFTPFRLTALKNLTATGERSGRLSTHNFFRPFSGLKFL